MKEALTFDDVLLVPQKSNVLPRQVNTRFKLTKKIELEIPMISAPMDTVTEGKMAIAMDREGGLGIIHKNLSIKDQAKEVKKAKQQKALVGAAVGVGTDTLKRVEELVKARVDILVVDSAHGHSEGVMSTVKMIKKEFKGIPVIAGNVATAAATRDLIKAGADAVKVGIGPGSICTTRVIAGVGVPQITAIEECAKAALKTKTPIIADGGIKHSGDIVKALAAGASLVMMGGILAGTWEAPGEVVLDKKKKKFKVYRGMGSLEAMKAGSKDRYLQGSIKEDKKLVPEGIVGKVPYKGSVDEVVYQLVGGLRSGMGYCGAKNISELWKKSEFVRITNAGLRESHPHDLVDIQAAPNY